MFDNIKLNYSDKKTYPTDLTGGITFMDGKEFQHDRLAEN